MAPNWNEYDADSFDPSLIQKVTGIVARLDIQPEIFPTAADSIQLEYYDENAIMTIEIPQNGDMSVFVERVSQPHRILEVPATANVINLLVKEFYNDKS